MKKLWNLLFYVTWISLNDLSYYMVVKPIQSISLKLYPRNKGKELKDYRRYIRRDRKLEQAFQTSTNINGAFRLMLLSTGCILISLSFVLLYFIEINGVYGSYIILLVSLLGSIFMNYFFLYRKDAYLGHFERNEKEFSRRKAYVLSFLFHSTALLSIFIL